MIDWLTNWLAKQVTNYMDQSPSLEHISPSVIQEIPLILWNPKVYKRQLPAPTLSQINPECLPNPPAEDTV
jgi:hypothetical protein